MPQEFQVVVLAGGSGSSMHPLTEEIPKALLPVANRPLLSYQLDLVENAGFASAFIVTTELQAPKLHKFVHEIYKGKVATDFILFKESYATGEVLTRIKDKLKTDFIVISSDLIVDDTFVHQMIDIHKSCDAAVTMLIKQPTEQIARVATKSSATKTTEQVSFDYIALDADKERVLLLTSSAEVESTFSISKSLLRRYPHMKVFSTLLDAHFYIFSKWVLDILDEQYTQKKFSSIKGDLVPYLISCQSSKRKQQELPESASASHQSLALSMSSTRKNQVQPYAEIQQHLLKSTRSLSILPEAYKTPNKQSLSNEAAPMDTDPRIGCYAHVMSSGYCMRANTIQSYMEMNRDIARAASKFLPWEQRGKNNFVHESASVHPQTQIGADCVVGQGSKIGERCSVKKSIIGKHCHIGDNVKITNSILMDHVIIGSNCNITDSIICDNVHMKESCNVKDSQMGFGFFLAMKSDIKNEILCKERIKI